MNANKKRELAEYLFIYDGMTGKEIADNLATTETTVSRWRTRYQWDDKKAAFTTNPEKLVKDFIMDISAIRQAAKDEKRNITSKEADSILKLTKSIEQLSRKLNVPQAVMVFKSFNEFLIRQENGLPLAKAIKDIQKRFVFNLMNDSI